MIEATEAGIADAVGVGDAGAAGAATGVDVIMGRVDETCHLRSTLRRRANVIREAMTIGVLRGIAAQVCRANAEMTTLSCRANPSPNTVGVRRLRLSSRWVTTNPKNVSLILNSRPRVRRLACSPSRACRGASPEACRIGS